MAGVQSIERAFAILRALAHQPAGITELASRVDLPKSTVARLLAALEAEGAAVRDDDDATYRIGTTFVDLLAPTSQRSLVDIARPFLIGLSAETGEATGLSIFDDGWVQFVDQAGSDQDIQVRDWTGEWGPAHSLPAGIVMLAHISSKDIDAYIAAGLEAMTPSTITSAEALRERLVQARSAGYAWGFEEFAEGINSVAAPLLNDNEVIGALHIHGPTYRFPDPNDTHDLGRLVVDTAARLSEQLTTPTAGS